MVSAAIRATRQAEIDALQSHQRPPMSMLGRRSEAAEMPFKFPGPERLPQADNRFLRIKFLFSAMLGSIPS